jgi:hypothetical protein
MANDRLFEMLAQAKAQPDRWARAVDTGAQAGQNIIGGYLSGKEIGQQLRQYKILNTPLGELFQDPSKIPFGLGPQHTVNDLRTVAGSLENWAPGDLISAIGTQYGANIAPTEGSRVEAPPASTQAPAPTIASTSMVPIPGAENPASPPGTTNLQNVQGTGGGNSANLPPGTSPTLNVPSGGMGMGAVQKLLIPALNAAREGRQFQQGQASENERARLSREQQHQQFIEAQQNEKNRTMAGETAKIAPSLTEAGTIQDDINALLPLYKGYSPIPFAGTTLANMAAKSGSSTFGTPTMQQGKQIQQIVPALAAKVNYLLNKRFNSGEAAMLQSQVVPNASDDEANAMQKIGNLRRFTAVMQGGDINALKMVAQSIAGQPVNPGLPSSGGTAPIQSPSNAGSGDPEADAAIQRIQSSGLNPQAKQARIMAVRARMGRHGQI